MTEAEYRKKQRILIFSFAIGAVIILVVFGITFSRRFSQLQLDNPLDEIVNEEDVDEWQELRRSIDELGIEEEGENSESQDSDSEAGETENVESSNSIESNNSSETLDSINRFIQN